MAFRRGGSLLPLSSVFASFIGAALVAGVFSYNNYRFSRYKFVDFSVLTFYEKSEVFVPEDDKFLLVVFSSKFGEIDVVAKKDGVLRFTEIKATQGDYEAEYRLTPAKFNKILKTIDFYLLQNGSQTDFQVDLIAIKKGEIKWIENISL